ncbi:VENN motif pre-toxin domain-containing protein, partial [Rahnella sp. CJA17(1/100)]|uniref:VENN motif pre-toxin domain-containing protein n=1 Tax=Rahnella sp. CJA17(1/100) TaxID=2508951 RepID=UPI001431BB46
TDAKGNVNEVENITGHALAGAVVAYLQGGSVSGGAAGAATGELAAQLIAKELYPGVKPENLTNEQKANVSALSTLAAGLAGGVAGDSSFAAGTGAVAGKTAVENNFLSVEEKTKLELAKQKLQNSKDPVEREQAQQQINDLREKDIASDKKVIDACSNGKAGSAGCASARLEVIAAKGEYETGQYNNKISDMYADSYGKIVNLLNITSVDAQNQQQVKDALTQYAMDVLGVDRKTAEGYAETKQGMDIIIASVTPIMGGAAASKLGNISTEANVKASLLKEMSSQGIKYTPENIVQVAKNSDGKIIFLESGNGKAGLQHIIDEHAKDFANIGVSEAQIPNVVMKAVSEGNIVGYQGKGTGRPIYETVINGEVHRLAITVSSNGFMVGANPAGRVK